MSQPAVLVVGDVMRDIVVRLRGPIRRGTDQGATIATMPGGSAANLAAWLADAGVPVRLLACVGRDDLAHEAARLDRLGVASALVGHPVLPTGALIALVDPDGERSFLTDRGANDALRSEDVPDAVIAGIAHLHVSGYAFVGAQTRATILGLMERARGRGVPISVDPGSSGFIADLGAAAMLDWCAGAALLSVNAAEAEALCGIADPAAQLARLAAGFDLVLLKRGAEGAMARARDGRRWRSRAPAVAVIDTIGAGDAFLAGFLAARLAGRDVGDSLAAAVARGTFAATRHGGLPPAAP